MTFSSPDARRQKWRARPIDHVDVLGGPTWRWKWLARLWERLTRTQPSLKQCGKWPAAHRVANIARLRRR